MRSVFVALVFCVLFFMAATGAVGFTIEEASGPAFRLHFAMGLVTALLACFAHVVTFTYFVVTGKVLMRAEVSGRIDPAAVPEARRLKARTMRLAVPAIASVILLAASGVYADAKPEAAPLHLGAFVLAVLANLGAFAGQYRCIIDNAKLLETALRQYRPSQQRG